MKFKATYIIGIICLALFAYVYFYEIRGGAEREKAKIEKKRFLRVDMNNIVKLQIIRGDTTITISKQNDNWMIQEPVYYKGDKTNIEDFITVIAQASKESEVSDDSSQYQSFGLKTGSAHIKAVLADGKEYGMVVGQLNSVGTSVYAKADKESKVYLTGTPVKSKTDQPLVYFRDKTIIEMEKDSIDKLVFYQKDKEFIVEKQGEQWKLTKPLQTDADFSKIDIILKVLVAQQIVEFADENPGNLEKYGLKNPINRVEVFNTKSKVKQTIYIGKYNKPYYYVKVNTKPHIFEVDTGFVKQLMPTFYDVRDKKILIFEIESINVLKITQNKTASVFNKNDSTGLWEMTKPLKKPANSEKITNIIKEIYWARAEKFIEQIGGDLKQYGLEPPEADFILLSKGKTIIHVQLGKAVDNKRYFYNKEKNALYLVRQATYDNIVVPEDKLIMKKEE